MGINQWLFIIVLALTGCKGCSTYGKKEASVKQHRPSTSQVFQSVKELKPDCQGDKCRLGYTYQDDTGTWWLMYWMVANQGSSYNNYYSNSPVTNNSAWEKSTAPANDQVVGEKETSVQETAQGEPQLAADPSVPEPDPNAVEPEQAQQDQQAIQSFENEGGSVTPDAPGDSSSGGDGSGGGGGDGGGGGGGGD